MQLCTERERLFVFHYVELGGSIGCGAKAAKLAGYSQHLGTSRVRAHMLLRRQRVLDALDEVGRQAFRALMVPAVMAAGRLIQDRKAKGHVAAVFSTLSRLGIVERTGVDVAVSGEVLVSHTEQAVESLRILKDLGVSREKLEEMYGYSGLERYEGLLAKRAGGMKQIEGEVVSRETSEPKP